MITFLRGTVFQVEENFVDLDVNGVGYRIFVPTRVAVQLAPNAETTLFVYHHVREDAQDLYGFLEIYDRDWFELLLGVSGIGPKGALQIVAAGNYQGFLTAISTEDSRFLSGLPGIGKKTAQRIILDLKDKVRPALNRHTEVPARVNPASMPSSSLQSDLVEALKSLGYNERQAMESVSAILREQGDDSGEELTLEKALTACLQRMDR